MRPRRGGNGDRWFDLGRWFGRMDGCDAAGMDDDVEVGEVTVSLVRSGAWSI